MPSEAEWEYACRADNSEDVVVDFNANTWYINNSGEQNNPIGRNLPNAGHSMTCMAMPGTGIQTTLPSHTPNRPVRIPEKIGSCGTVSGSWMQMAAVLQIGKASILRTTCCRWSGISNRSVINKFALSASLHPQVQPAPPLHDPPQCLSTPVLHKVRPMT